MAEFFTQQHSFIHSFIIVTIIIKYILFAVPLGETSINFENYLSQQSHAVPDTPDAPSDMSSGKTSP